MEASLSPMTLEAYASLDDPDDLPHSELVGGLVVREPRPGGAHGLVQVNLAHALRSWTANRPKARVFVESGFVLARDPPTVRGPDVGVMLRSPTFTEHGGWVEGAPEVAAEIPSPSDASTAVHRKVLDYLEAGSRLVWIVDPAARSVTVYRPDGSARLLTDRDELSGEAVLEGFALPLGLLFEV